MDARFEEGLGGGFRLLATEESIKVRGAHGLEFEYTLGSGSLAVWPGDASGLSLTHALADTAVPFVLSTMGPVVLHAAGLVTEGRCIAVLGETMTGKSTLTGRWVARGGQFLSDDWLPIRARGAHFTAEPSHPSIRLRSADPDLVDLSGVACQSWKDGYAKRWLTFEPGSPAYPGRPALLRAIVVYKRSREAASLSARTLGPQEALLCLLSNTLAFDHLPRRRWHTMLERIRHAVDGLPVEEVVVPGGPAALEELAAWIERRARSSG